MCCWLNSSHFRLRVSRLSFTGTAPFPTICRNWLMRRFVVKPFHRTKTKLAFSTDIECPARYFEKLDPFSEKRANLTAVSRIVLILFFASLTGSSITSLSTALDTIHPDDSERIASVFIDWFSTDNLLHMVGNRSYFKICVTKFVEDHKVV